MDLDDSELYWTRKQKGLATEKETEEYIRSLEKKIKELENTNKKLYELCQGKTMQEFINNECDYIPKSKVREKRKEIYDFIDSSQGCMAQEDLYREWGKIEMCDELLQEGDK